MIIRTIRHSFHGPSKQRGIIIAAAIFAAGEELDPLTIDGGPNVQGGGSGMSNCGNPGATGITNAVGSGGLPPLIYQWTQTGTPATKGPWIPVSATDPSTTFGGSTNVCDGENFTETWEIKVTDDLLDTATDTITVTRSWTDIT